jgi:leucyl-tRNA synthetase
MGRAWRLVAEAAAKGVNGWAKPTKELLYVRNKIIKDVTERMANLTFNTAISAFMEGVNSLLDIAKTGGVDKETLESFVVMLAPFAPYAAAEMWEVCGNATRLYDQTWPKWDESALTHDEIVIVIQINGKVRENIHVPTESSKEEIIRAAKQAARAKFPADEPKKEIYVPGRLVNFVF